MWEFFLLVAQPDDLSDIDIWMSMSIIYISKSKWQRNIVQQCATDMVASMEVDSMAEKVAEMFKTKYIKPGMF